jgi:hypothetical protein
MVAAAVGVGSMVAGVAGSAMSASAAGDAAASQAQSAQNTLQFSQAQYADQQKNIAPYLAAGQSGLTGYQNLLGSNGVDAQNTAVGNIKNGAQYQGDMQTANQNILANASATGGLRGSNTSNTLANTSISTLNGLITNQLAGYGSMIGNGLSGITGQQAANTASLGAVTGANNTIGNAGAMQATSMANSFNSGLGAITQGANRYAAGFGGSSPAANNPTYGQTSAGNPIYFTGQ